MNRDEAKQNNKRYIEDQIETMLEKVMKDDNDDDFEGCGKSVFTMGSSVCDEMPSFMNEMLPRKDNRAKTLKVADNFHRKTMLPTSVMPTVTEEINEYNNTPQRGAKKFRTVNYNNNDSPIKPIEMENEFPDCNFGNIDLNYMMSTTMGNSSVHNGR
jgi:hypothetical protein